MSKITVMLVDDHPVVREGIRAIISLEPDMEVISEAGDGRDAIEQFTKSRPNVILMDLLLPDISGWEATETICKLSGDVQVVVLSSIGGDEDIYRALEAGARGYLFKDSVRKDLLVAIRTVHSGMRYIPPAVGARLAEHIGRSGLSSREIEVLQLVAVGLRNKEIAFQLGISEATVNAHIKRILQKLDASDRTEAVSISLRRGIIHL